MLLNCFEVSIRGVQFQQGMHCMQFAVDYNYDDEETPAEEMQMFLRAQKAEDSAGGLEHAALKAGKSCFSLPPKMLANYPLRS